MRPIRPRQNSRLRLLAFIALGAMTVLFLSANGVAGFYTDWLWFDNMGLRSVWSTTIQTQLALGAGFSLLFFGIMWVNLYFADRSAPELRTSSPEEELVERYQALVGGRAGLVRLVVAAGFAVIAGLNTSTQWQTWLMFRNGGDFGRVDPLFGRDAGFYVFQLPFITFVVDWLFATLILTLIASAVFHYLNGGIRAAVTQDRVSPATKLHLSILVAVLALLRAAAYYLDRFHLVTNSRQDLDGALVDGALATDVNVQLPALQLLTLISLFCAGLFIINTRREGWGLPAVAIGIWVLSHFVMAGIFPLIYQRVRIEPVKSERQAEFVERNIEATRFAYGLDESRLTEIPVSVNREGVTQSDIDDYADVLRNVPVVDPELAVDEVQRSEAERGNYTFAQELDVDRYEIDGEVRPVALSVRGLDIDQVGSSWEQQHITFTHGTGVALAAAYDSGRVEGESRSLDFLVRGLGTTIVRPSIDVAVEQPRVYFGENLGGYAIVGAARDEVDYPTANNQNQLYRYTGDGGVDIGSFPRRLAYSLRFREPDPLISDSVSGDSRVIYHRDIVERVRKVAPFLRLDANPYPVLVDGGIKWVIDAYTTTSEYPYSQAARTSVGGDLAGGYNYVRNSVKAVIDAYDGTVDLYVVDDADPLIQAWQGAYPDLFTDADEVADQLRQHFRYPEGIFTVQTDMWERYTVADATQFIEGSLYFSVAAQPAEEAENTDNELNPVGSMDPQYRIARVPVDGAPESEFVLQRAFVPSGGAEGTSARPELTGLMMARSDPENYGQLVMATLEAGEVPAPNLAHVEIRKDEDLTTFVRNKAGADVLFGEMSIVLIEDSIVYVRPVYVKARSNETAVPELQRVVAFSDNRIFMGQSVQEAISGVLRTPVGDVDPGEPSEQPDSGSVDSPDLSGRSVIDLISLADSHLQNADAAEQDGRTAEAAQLRDDARAALEEVQELLGGTLRAPAAVSPPPSAPADLDSEIDAEPDGELDAATDGADETAAGG